MFDFFAGIADIFGGAGSIIGAVEAFLSYVWNVLRVVTLGLLRIIRLVGDFFWGILGKVKTFLLHIWDGFFKRILDKFFQLMFKIHDWLEAHLRPIIDFIRKVQRILDHIYARYIRPVLNTIHRVRQLLLVLRLLHVKFAEELDRKLAGIERKISGTFLQVRSILTLTLDLLNVIVDPSKLLRRPTLIISLRRSVLALIRAITGLPPGFFFPSPKPNVPRGVGPVPHNFDAANPLHNPPASYYLALEEPLPAFGFLSTEGVPEDSDADMIEPLDFWNTSYYKFGDCDDPLLCLYTMLKREQDAISPA